MLPHAPGWWEGDCWHCQKFHSLLPTFQASNFVQLTHYSHVVFLKTTHNNNIINNNNLVLRPLSTENEGELALEWKFLTLVNQPCWSSIPLYSEFSSGLQEILLTVLFCADLVLKVTGWHASWQYYRNGTLTMSINCYPHEILCRMTFLPQRSNTASKYTALSHTRFLKMAVWKLKNCPSDLVLK